MVHSLNHIAQGNNYNQRIGAKIIVTSIIIRAYFKALDVRSTPMMLTLVLDTQANGQTADHSDVFEQGYDPATGNFDDQNAPAYVNVTPAVRNRKRFKILKQWIWNGTHFNYGAAAKYTGDAEPPNNMAWGAQFLGSGVS